MDGRDRVRYLRYGGDATYPARAQFGRAFERRLRVAADPERQRLLDGARRDARVAVLVELALEVHRLLQIGRAHV